MAGKRGHAARRGVVAVLAVSLGAVTLAACTTPPAPAAPTVQAHTVVNTVDAAGRGTLTVDGCQLLGPTSPFTQRVDGLPAVSFPAGADPLARAAALLAANGRTGLGSGSSNAPYQGSVFGFPLNTVDGTTRPVTIGTSDYGYQVVDALLPANPADVHWEGEPNAFDFDRHLLVLDRTSCRLQEHISYNHLVTTSESAVGWTLPVTSDSRGLRTDPVTGQPLPASVEAAGLPITPLSYRFAEVFPGGTGAAPAQIHHALRIAAPKEVNATTWVWPANRTDGIGPAVGSVPMGTRLRLSAAALARVAPSVGPGALAVLTALHRYGSVVADSTPTTTDPSFPGGFGLSGEYHPSWPASLSGDLRRVGIADFEVVDTSCWQGTTRLTVRPAPLPSSC